MNIDGMNPSVVKEIPCIYVLSQLLMKILFNKHYVMLSSNTLAEAGHILIWESKICH